MYRSRKCSRAHYTLNSHKSFNEWEMQQLAFQPNAEKDLINLKRQLYVWDLKPKIAYIHLAKHQFKAYSFGLRIQQPISIFLVVMKLRCDTCHWRRQEEGEVTTSWAGRATVVSVSSELDDIFALKEAQRTALNTWKKIYLIFASLSRV